MNVIMRLGEQSGYHGLAGLQKWTGVLVVAVNSACRLISAP
ncbi:hypothetical protein [Dactylosporangium sp. CS-033363]